MAISEKKRLEVANVCYASVSGLFALFVNSKNRGHNFTWDWFIEMCEAESKTWLMRVRGSRDEINILGKELAGEISRHLVNRMGVDE